MLPAFDSADDEATALWTDLLATAILAPSPHNVQPWAVRIADRKTAVLFVDLQRALPKEDVTGSFLISAMGTFLETLAIAASNAQLRLEYELLCDLTTLPSRICVADELLPFAQLRLASADATKAEYTKEDVERRATARMAYEIAAVPETDLRRVGDVASAHGLRFGFTQDEATIRVMLGVNVDALFYDLNDPKYHDEIAMWFRCGVREERAHQDGLSSRCMCMSPMELSIAKRSPAVLRVPLVRDIAGLYYRRTLATPCVGWLSGDFWEPEAALRCGHALMRCWLTITQLGLSLHPLGNLVTNRDAAARIASLTGAKDIWFIFKLGYARNVPKSLRRPVAAFLR